MSVDGMPKVVHLTNVHPCHNTRILYKECQTLAQEGFEVVLVVPHEEKIDGVIGGVRIRSIPKPRNRLQRMICTGYRAFRTSLQEDADLYHIHDPELLPWAQLLRLSGKPVIYDMHEYLRGAILDKGWIRPFLRRPVSAFMGRLERMLMSGLPVIFAEYSYRKHCPHLMMSATVLNLPDVSCFLSIQADKYEQFTAGYMGGVCEARGSLAMLEALRILRDQGQRIGFQCVGPVSEEHMRVLRSRIDPDQAPDVRFHGQLIQQDGWRIMARCHVGLAVLQAVPNYLESYPTKMFEYMVLGMPVVVSDFPLYRDIVERYRCGFCVDPSNPGQLAEALLYLSRHAQEAAAMGARGREAVRNDLNWATESRKLIGFYRTLLSA
jgi:glycosyltransferase involved in cell wall biosynthesis